MGSVVTSLSRHLTFQIDFQIFQKNCQILLPNGQLFVKKLKKSQKTEKSPFQKLKKSKNSPNNQTSNL